MKTISTTGLLLEVVFQELQYLRCYRHGLKVLLLEKPNIGEKPAKDFMNGCTWDSIFSCSRQVINLRYLLGATDDLFEFYGSFDRMNLVATEVGSKIEGTGWFNNDYVEYKYRIRRFNPIWMSLVSRSINIINLFTSTIGCVESWIRVWSIEDKKNFLSTGYQSNFL